MAGTPRILIVDDEANVRFVLEKALLKDKYQVDTASDGNEAIRKLGAANYDLILLDLQMRPVGGEDVLRAAHLRDPDAVVIILTGHATLGTAVEAVHYGAFDYVLKPADPQTIRKRVREGLERRRELRSRTHLLGQISALRSSLIGLDLDGRPPDSPSASGRSLASGKVVIDQQHRVARLDDRQLNLTTAEFDILICLVRQAPSPVAPRTLVNQALQYDVGETEAREIIKYHIHQLRRKIEGDVLHPRLIKTVRYKGYLWSGE